MGLLDSLSDEIASVVALVRPSVLHLRVLGEKHMATGSGFLCRAPGLVLTNSHVVGNALAVEATMHDGRTTILDVVGTDPATDLALLRMPPDFADSKPLQLADSSALRVGSFVLAIGCPHGLAHSVTQGILSGLGRTLPQPSGRTIEDVLQTDAPLNPGNSGGPLLDTSGRVIGIATAIVPMAQGLCFAVPAHTAEVVMTELQHYGKVERGWLGIAVQAVEIAPAIARRLQLPSPRTVAVGAVTQNSPAAHAGLLPGDLLLAIDSRAIRGAGDLLQGLPRTTIGQPVQLRVLRQNEILTLTATPFRAAA
ncbi:MAG: trypsin-like peptidase domain-containing protein [Planctomycetota bacterium]